MLCIEMDSGAERRMAGRAFGLAAVGVWIVLAVAAISGDTAKAQSVTAVPKLDLAQLQGTWYEIALYPDKREKTCARDGMRLMALGDAKRSLQIVDSCTTTKGFQNVRNANAKQDKAGDGKLKVVYFWPFSTKYWVLGEGTDKDWLLVGSPNHKNLWLLSSKATLPADTLTQVEAQAASAGFSQGKLKTMPQDQQ